MGALESPESAGRDINDSESDRGWPDPIIPADDTDRRRTFLAALREHSLGNALYATYLCREVIRNPEAHVDPGAAIRTFPHFDGTLQAYYEHIGSALDGSLPVARLIALLEFAVTRSDLRDMCPEYSPEVDRALSVLEPVLIERSSQGGIRFYHESFARFLLLPLSDHPETERALLKHATDWLARRGLFDDPLAFRYLLPTLYRAGDYRAVVGLVDADFVATSIAARFTRLAIAGNVATAIASAAELGDWGALCRFVELSRAADRYEFERLGGTVVEFSDVAIDLFGSGAFADRLLYEGSPTVPSREGLQLCAKLDEAGGVAPWSEYLRLFDVESADDTTMYGQEADRSVALAILRGQLRLRSIGSGKQEAVGAGSDLGPELRSIARWLDQMDLPPSDVIEIIMDTLGIDAIQTLVPLLKVRGLYALALAENIASTSARRSRSEAVSIQSVAVERWLARAVEYGLLDGNLHRLLRLGFDVTRVNPQSMSGRRRAREPVQ